MFVRVVFVFLIDEICDTCRAYSEPVMRLGLHRRIIHAGADTGFYLGWGAIFLGKSRDSCMCRWYMRKGVKEGYVDVPVCKTSAPTGTIYKWKCNFTLPIRNLTFMLQRLSQVLR